jgi:hypothetical protein
MQLIELSIFEDPVPPASVCPCKSPPGKPCDARQVKSQGIPDMPRSLAQEADAHGTATINTLSPWSINK